MVVSTIDNVREQLKDLGVKHTGIYANSNVILLDFNQCVMIPANKEYASVDELRNEIVGALANLFLIQREAYGRFETADKIRRERIEQCLREELS